MKVGDLVKINYNRGQGSRGIVVTEPRFGVNTMSMQALHGKVCEVLFSATNQVATRVCNDLVVISETR